MLKAVDQFYIDNNIERPKAKPKAPKTKQFFILPKEPNGSRATLHMRKA